MSQQLRQGGAAIAAVCLAICFGAGCSSTHVPTATSSSVTTSTISSATTSPPSTSTSAPSASEPTTTRPTAPVSQTVNNYCPSAVTVAYSPGSGPPGTHVRVTGSGFVGQCAQTARGPAYRFNLIIELPGCELIGGPPTPSVVDVSSSGALSGSFTVPSTGDCFQQANSTRALPSGQYRVTLGSHSADLGTFTVTSS
jgi:hypothetical protein